MPLSEIRYRVFRVTLQCVGGQAVLDVPSTNEDSAQRRAYWTAVHLRWGEPDEVTVLQVVELHLCGFCSNPVDAHDEGCSQLDRLDAAAHS